MSVNLQFPTQPNLRFFSTGLGEYEDSVWSKLKDGYLEESNLFGFEDNVLAGRYKKHQHKQILAKHLHSYTGQDVNYNGVYVDYQLSIVEGEYQFLEAVEKFFSAYENEVIGIHVSGGVDSSLIIGCLRKLGIPYKLVGVTTERYEFRTERLVQKRLLEEAEQGILLDHESCLPFSDLRSVPPHQIPELGCTGYGIGKMLTEKAAELGVTLLLSGSGGDLVLGGSTLLGSSAWKVGMFNDWWSQDIISSPLGIKALSFYSDPDIAFSIRMLRDGQGEDLRKCWARRYFKDFLPRELVEYTYKADFWGIYMDGLRENKHQLLTLEEEAFDLTGMKYFRDHSIRPLLEAANTECEMEINQRIEARVAAAAWVVSLKKTFFKPYESLLSVYHKLKKTH